MRYLVLASMLLMFACKQKHEWTNKDGSVLKYATVNGKKQGKASLFYKNGKLHGNLTFNQDTIVIVSHFDFNNVLYHSMDLNKVHHQYMYYRSDTSLYQIMYSKDGNKVDSLATFQKGTEELLLKAHFIRNLKDLIDIVSIHKSGVPVETFNLSKGKYRDLEKRILGKDTLDIRPSYYPITNKSELKTMPNKLQPSA